MSTLSSNSTPPSSTFASQRWLSRVLYLGTGTSAQVPAIHCLLPSPTTPRRPGPAEPEPIACAACSHAVEVPGSKNRRGCTSVALIGGGRPQADEPEELLLIDCGPTFYPSALTHFRPHSLPRRISGVLLTHGHADAVLGLDNLRAWTMGGLQSCVDVYLTKETMKVVEGAFPYLVDRSKATGGGGVGALRWKVIDGVTPFRVGEVEVTPLPVLHGFADGGSFGCLGFRVDGFSYVSDCVSSKG